jgi:carboxylesterase type B
LRNGSYADWPDAETLGVQIAGKLGAADLAALRSASAEAIVEAASAERFFALGTIDGHTLRRQIVDVFDRGEQAPVPVLAGFNDGEIRNLRVLLPPAPADAEAYTREIRARYGDLADAFLSSYPAKDFKESMLATTRDALYGWTSERLAAKHAAIGAPAFLYYFNHGFPAADQRGYHAFHGAEGSLCPRHGEPGAPVLASDAEDRGGAALHRRDAGLLDVVRPRWRPRAPRARKTGAPTARTARTWRSTTCRTCVPVPRTATS